MLTTGIALVVLVPLMALGGYLLTRAGMLSEFWRLPLEDKLDHIATRKRVWWATGIIWVAMLAFTAGGMTSLAAQLDEPIAWVALGILFVGVVAWLVGITLQTAGLATASTERTDTGVTPSWVQPLWAAGWMSELTWVIAANIAAVLFGIAVVGGNLVDAWAGWVAIAIGTGISVTVATTRYAFPEMGLLAPIVFGVALLVG
jgi:hypothetical protein